MVSYVKEDAKNLLMSQFGWQPYPQKHFESRFTKFYESYWLPKRFGYDVRRVQFSSLILTGQMDREYALKILEEPSYDESTIGHEIEFVASKLQVSVEDMDSFMALPHKNYKDYKNQWKLYHYGRQVMRAMGLELGGKR
jgi:hypothetical protein